MKRVILDQEQHNVVLSKANHKRLIAMSGDLLGLVIIDRNGHWFVRWQFDDVTNDFSNVHDLIQSLPDSVKIYEI